VVEKKKPNILARAFPGPLYPGPLGGNTATGKKITGGHRPKTTKEPGDRDRFSVTGNPGAHCAGGYCPKTAGKK